MFLNGKLWSLTNTKSCFFTFAIFALFVYSILLNKCFVKRVHNILSAVDTYSLINRTYERNTTEVQDAHVRLIPLITWVDLNKLSEKELENSKYRLIGKSDFRPVRKLPDALVIGVKKSGTRALLEFLRLHPDVRAAGSEIHFFDKFYHKGFSWYRRKMPPTLEGQITMEKTPSYFVTREAPLRVKQMNPRTKLLVVVRDPVTRLISDYAQAASKNENRGYMQKFECLAFVKGTGFSVVDTSWAPVRIGVYARHLSKWLKYFPLEQLIFVSGERLISDPAAEMARVQDFLGLKRVVNEKHFYFNATKGFPCLMKSEGRPAPHCLGKTKGRDHPYINPKAVLRLREFYRPFNLRFYQMTGINFGWA